MWNLISALLYYSGAIKILRFLGRHDTKILLYHSVSDTESCFIKGTYIWVSTGTFEKHLNYLSKHHKLISLRTLVDSLKEGRIPPRSAVITFDDGFADNFRYAYPSLKRYKIPATIFICPACIDNKKSAWIFELYYLINMFGVENVIKKIKSLPGKPDRDISTDAPGEALSNKVEEYMAYCLRKEDREKILTGLYQAFGISREKVLSDNRLFLTWEEIKQMCQDGMEFGNHGESHTPFSALSLNEQKMEIVNSKKMIRENLGTDFLPFAYPVGQSRDFTPETEEIVETTGHNCIVTTRHTLNRSGTSPFDLGRIHAGEIPVHRLALELEKSLLKHLLRRLGFLRADG
jgi:peptidoglycan/xylan/chitin deacetylase (PgdA/CDA1 family)